MKLTNQVLFTIGVLFSTQLIAQHGAPPCPEYKRLAVVSITDIEDFGEGFTYCKFSSKPSISFEPETIEPKELNSESPSIAGSFQCGYISPELQAGDLVAGYFYSMTIGCPTCAIYECSSGFSPYGLVKPFR